MMSQAHGTRGHSHCAGRGGWRWGAGSLEEHPRSPRFISSDPYSLQLLDLFTLWPLVFTQVCFPKS